jgi:exosortase
MSPAVQVEAKRVSAPGRELLVFAALFVICYAPSLRSLLTDWSTNDDMGHGFFVPIVAGYIVWQEREALLAIPAKANWWGVGLVLLGAAQSLLATLGVELFLSRSALVVTLAGAVWTVCGTQWLKKLAFPIVLLGFMVPLPAVIYNSLTFPLQLLASQLAETALSLLNIPVVRNGNVLELPSGPLSVVEACSGIRSLLSLTFLSLVYGYFFETSVRVRAGLFLATIPIAILVNGLRVTVTGVLAEIKPELAQGFFHESTGWVLFMLALGLLVLLHLAVTRAGKLIERRRKHDA